MMIMIMIMMIMIMVMTMTMIMVMMMTIMTIIMIMIILTMFSYLGPAGAACGLSELALLVSACLHNDGADDHDHDDPDDGIKW